MHRDPLSSSLGRFAAKFRNGIAQHIVDRRSLPTSHPLLQRRDPRAYRIERRPHRLCCNDAGDSDLGGLFAAREQNFVQPFAWTDTGVRDLDISSRFESREPDDPFGEINDFDRLSHVENIDGNVVGVIAECVRRRCYDQIARLANGHEITHHVGMRDGHRPTRFNLRLELRHPRAVRGEYISARRLVAPSTDTGSIALSVEIITMAVAPAAEAASATLIDPNTLVLMPSSQSCSSIGTCLSAAA